MARINKQWKKFMAVGCSHGYWADPTALAWVLEFKKRWKPDTRVHLGDYMEDTSFRSGATLADHKGDIRQDLQQGVEFITQFEPTLLFNGNHDVRVWQSLDDTNAWRREVANEIVESVHKAISKSTEFVEDYDQRGRKAVRTIADLNLLHGYMYNENGIRDHAAHYGKCLFAHLHKVGSAPASRLDSPVGYCAGYLGDIDKFDYAARRQAVSQWSQGFAWGEYSDKECMVWLYERSKTDPNRLPV